MNRDLFEIIMIVLGAIAATIYLIDFGYGKGIKTQYRVLLISVFAFSLIVLAFRLKGNPPTDTETKKPVFEINDSIKKQPADTATGPVANRVSHSVTRENKSQGTVKTDPGDKAVAKQDATPVNQNEIETNYINKPSGSNDIAVLVIDNSGNSINTIASEIAKLYRSKGYSVTTSLFTNDFLRSKYLNEVQSGNAKVLDKLGLAPVVNYIVIAKYSNTFETGELTKWVSRASLEVSIISCISKSQVDAFSINPSSGFDDKQNAERGAIEKIVSAYKTSHLNL